MFNRNITTFIIASLLAACAANPRVVSTNPLSGSAAGDRSAYESFSITSTDVAYAANEAIQQFLESPESIKPGGGRWVMNVGEVVNDTLQMFETRRLTAQMKQKLRMSNRFRFVNTEGPGISAATIGAREVQDSALFDQSTVAQDGTLMQADLYLEGLIGVDTTQSADMKQQQLSYFFILEVTEKNRGMQLFEAYIPIDKTGSNQNFAW